MHFYLLIGLSYSHLKCRIHIFFNISVVILIFKKKKDRKKRKAQCLVNMLKNLHVLSLNILVYIITLLLDSKFF